MKKYCNLKNYRSVASRTVKFCNPHWANRCAAERPAIPAPIITTVGSGLQGSNIHGSSKQESNLFVFPHCGISFPPPPLSDEKNLHVIYHFLIHFLSIFKLIFKLIFNSIFKKRRIIILWHEFQPHFICFKFLLKILIIN